MSARPFKKTNAKPGLIFIRDAGFETPKSGGKPRRRSIFKCPFCEKEVNRDHDSGMRRMKSCGCQWQAARMTHGRCSGGKKSAIYQVFDGMKQRCLNPNCANYPIYGGRGITICDEWKDDPETFFAWAEKNGYVPHEVEIDRINTDGNYEPSNCRFVTAAINAANRRYVRLNNAIPATVRALIKAGFRQRDIHLLANSRLTRSTITMIAIGKIWKPTT